MHDLESARILIATSRSDGDRLNHKCVRPLTYQDNQSSYCYQILQVAGLVSEALLIHYSLNIQLRENPRETRKTWLLKCISDGNELPYLNKVVNGGRTHIWSPSDLSVVGSIRVDISDGRYLAYSKTKV